MSVTGRWIAGVALLCMLPVLNGAKEMGLATHGTASSGRPAARKQDRSKAREEVAEFVYASVRDDSLATDHNSGRSLDREVNSRPFRELVARGLTLDPAEVLKPVFQITRRKNKTAAPEESDFPLNICGYRQGAARSAFDRIARAVADYVAIRQCGHTKEYATASLRQKWQPTTSQPAGDILLIRKKDPTVPIGWLRPDPYPISNDDDDRAYRRRWLVLDGRIAWTYEMQKTSTGPWAFSHWERIDAQEFDPKLHLTFEQARKEARDYVRRNMESLEFGACNSYWLKLGEILRKRYGLHWQSPLELNPQICYD